MDFRKRVVMGVAGILALVSGLARAQQVSSVPPAIVRALNARYPGWVFPAVAPKITAQYKGKTFFPNLVFGDYDGDRIRDYAIRIATGKAPDRTQTIIAFLQRGQTFEPHILDSMPDSPTTYLWPAVKGAKDHDYETNKDFMYANDAIKFLIDEKAGVSFVFEKGDFRRVTTSD